MCIPNMQYHVAILYTDFEAHLKQPRKILKTSYEKLFKAIH